ncbi:alpha/beta hydrolase family protein [Embleya scabrispora]|uniref:alpha/beta hydrolase family protein n=1 Tax=Embleya scabrispora TaxID=159449 RepID=UPI001374C450|nr:alpha/beta hydrolase [Embleya scabrispora]
MLDHLRRIRSQGEKSAAVVADLPVGALLRSVPSSVGFGVRSYVRSLRAERRRHPEIPTVFPTPGLVSAAFLDELVVAVLAGGRLSPDPEDVQRIRIEIADAVAKFRAESYLDDPTRFHPRPPAPDDPVLRDRLYGTIGYEQLTFESGYMPRAGVPGATRWQGAGANQRVWAYVLRHPGAPRPWLVNLHGFGMGRPGDLAAFRSQRLHRELGVNVIHPVLPMHGPRKSTRTHDGTFISFDYLGNVHGLGQAVWDVRRCLAWVRGQGDADTPVAVHGLSLGAYVAALVAGLEDLDCVIVGVPSVDMAWVMSHHVPEDVEREVRAAGLLGADAETVHRVVSPLAVTPRVPLERRFVYAGLADRMATPQQAYRLWKHWEEPSVCWYRGSHIGAVWNRQAHRFIEDALTSSGIGRRKTW